MEKDINNTTSDSKVGQINLRDAIKKASYHWRFFLISVIVALILAFVYLKFATYKYEVSSTILINDVENDGGSTSEIGVFQDLGLFAGPKISLDTEIGILKSKTLIERVIKDLGINITYFENNQLAQNEIYDTNIPFKFNFSLNELGLKQLNAAFTLRPTSQTRFEILNDDDEKIVTGDFGQNITWDYGDFLVTPRDINNVEQKEIIFKISPLEEVAIAYKRNIDIVQENPKSNLLIISLQSPIKLKAREILDSLVSYYNQDAIDYKNLIAENTNEFLNNRIEDISIELKTWDEGVESYKAQNKLSNIEYESNINLTSNASITKQINELSAQIRLADYLIDYMKTNDDDIIPGNLGLMDDNVNQNIVNYNNLILERNRMLNGANKLNPIIINLDRQIKSLRQSIDRSLVNQRSSLSIQLDGARRQENKLDSQIFETPKKERDLKVIQRQQDIIETLYLYLLQKREENSISMAVTAPYAVLIDKAYGSSVPVSPRKLIVLIASLILGILVPSLVIVLRTLFHNKVDKYEDIAEIVEAPLIGDIPKAKNGEDLASAVENKSIRIKEAFRLLRTNVIHFLRTNKNSSHALFITSTTRGEGKTYIASRLATALSSIDKKVLLIEANVNSPQLSEELGLKGEKGLSHFLSDAIDSIESIIQRDEKLNVDIIAAGSSLDQQSELLNKSGFEEIIKFGRQHYDFVVVDTPSVNENSDTLTMARHADLVLYVIRANTLTEKMLSVPKRLYESNRLPHMHIVMTDTNYLKLGYDYGNASLNKSLWKKVFR